MPGLSEFSIFQGRPRYTDGSAIAYQRRDDAAALRAALDRVTASLRTFIHEHRDPGVEALTALWEAERILETIKE